MPSNVSKLLPLVSITTSPDDGAVQFHHTDLPPAFPPWFGSPVSLVALLFVPPADVDDPLKVIAPAKLSFAGGAVPDAVASQSEALIISLASSPPPSFQPSKRLLP